MISLMVEFFVKLLGHSVPSLVRWRYPPERLSEMLKIRVREHGDGIVFRGGEVPSAQVWIRVTNLSPFPIVMDRMYGEFWYGTRLAPYQDLQNRSVWPSQEIEILIEAPLTAPQEVCIRKNQDTESSKIVLNALCRCKVRDFQIVGRDVEYRKPRLMNFNQIAQQSAAADAEKLRG